MITSPVACENPHASAAVCPELRAKRDHAHILVRGFDLPQRLDTAVDTSVVHEYQFVRTSETLHHAGQFHMQRGETIPLVVERNDY